MTDASVPTKAAAVPDPAQRSRGPADRRARQLRRDLRTVATFIQVDCDAHHRRQPRCTPTLKGYDLDRLTRRPLLLCADCRKLLAHALVKRTLCPLDPKPACKDCPEHCYAPTYRARIRQVMRRAGTRLVLRGRLDYLWHLLR